MKTLSRPTPDYGFENGLQWQQFRFEGGQKIVLPSGSMSRAQLLGLPNSGQNKERDERVVEQMASPFVQHVGKTAVELVAVGPEDADRILVSLYGWGGNTRHPVAVNEALALAANNPDDQIIFINTPGAGRSSLLPRSVEKEITSKGSYLGQGEILAGALRSIVDGRPVHLRGHSLGGRQATAIAPHLEQGAETLIINDPTGTRKLGLLGIANAYVAREGRNLRKYLRVTPYPEVAKVHGDPVAAAMKESLEGAKGSLWHQFVIDPLGLSRGGLEDDLRMAAPYIHRLILGISPDLSALNNPDDLANILGRISSLSGLSAEVQQRVLKDHTHAWIAAAPAIEGKFYEAA